MRSVMFKFLAGAVAGLVAWALMEPSAPSNYHSSQWRVWEGAFLLTIGSLIGMVVGGLEGYTRGGRVHTARGLGLGLIFGAVGASFGAGIGGAVLAACFRADVFDTGAFPLRMAARAVVFIPIGMFLGAAIGGSSLTLKRTVQGMVGGGIGGAISGLCFDPVSTLVGGAVLAARGQQQGEVGIFGRALTAVLLGATIALFIGLVERFARSAWLQLALGRNEGKEWSLDGVQTFIGRSESVQVPLFGDPNVAPVHASIVRQGANYVLVDNGSPLGTYLNGQRVGQAVLFPGAEIQIAGFRLQFLMKGHAAPARGPEMYGGQAYPMGGVPMAPQQPQGWAPMPSQPTQAFPAAPVSNPTVAFASPARPGGFVLVALDGPLLGQRFVVAGPMDVGRECPGIPMSFDTGASRRHASLIPSFNGISVNDLGSTNGTFLNGQRVSQATAGPGDMVKLGSTTFRVETA